MKQNPFERLPDTVEIDGAAVRIAPDFRVGVAIETELLTGEPDAAGLLTAFYPDGIPENVEAAAERMMQFYAHMDGGTSDGQASHSGARLYDFAQDADALMASFRQAYGIDLDMAPLHWWKFRRLMFGLPPETPFMQRVHYRAADITKLPKEQRKHYRKMKRLYALQAAPKKKMTAAERDAEMIARVRKRAEQVQRECEESQYENES